MTQAASPMAQNMNNNFVRLVLVGKTKIEKKVSMTYLSHWFAALQGFPSAEPPPFASLEIFLANHPLEMADLHEVTKCLGTIASIRQGGRNPTKERQLHEVK